MANVRTAWSVGQIFDSSRIGGKGFIELGNVPMPKLLATDYTIPYAMTAKALVSNIQTTNKVYICPFTVMKKIIVTEMGMNSWGAVNATSHIGIYDITTTRKPYNLIYDSGEVSVNSTGLIYWSVSNLVLYPSLYWIAYVCNGASKINAVTTQAKPLALTLSDTAWTIGYYYDTSILPSDASGLSFSELLISSGGIPAIGFKWTE